MADIVKMGRPQAKTSVPKSSLHSGNHQNVFSTPAASHHNLNVTEANNEWPSIEPNVQQSDEWPSIDPNVQQSDEWPSAEHPPTVVVDAHPNSEYYTNTSNFGEANRQLQNHGNEFVAEDSPAEDENPDDVGSASIPAKIISDDNPGTASGYDDNLYKDINSYQSHRHPFDDNEGESDASFYWHCCLFSIKFTLNIM